MKLEIPVEPHVYKFLTSPEMYGDTLPLKARKDTLLGHAVIMLARKGSVESGDYYHERMLPVIPKELVMLPIETTYPLKAEMINEESLMYASQLLSMMFETQVIFYTLGYMAREGSERGAIFKMYQHFGLEDDPIKQEALRGVSKRYRKSVMINHQKSDKKKSSRCAENISKFNENLSQRLNKLPSTLSQQNDR